MITYAGVPLSVASPELALHVERTVSPRDVYQFERFLWPGKSRAHWTFPGQLGDRPVKVGSLYWPRSASRWAVGHFLATDVQLAQVRTQVYSGSSGYQACPLALTWENQAGLIATVTTSLWALPARPLFQPADGRGLWLLTLVDDRYFWWQRSTGDLTVADNTTPWTDLYAALPVSVAADAIPAAYLKPSGSLTSRFEPLPLFLDAVAYNLGQRVCRRLDGTVRAENYSTAKTVQQANLQAAWPVHAGGQLALTPGQPNDLLALLPGGVRLTFPRQDDGDVTSGDTYEQTVTLSSLALADLPGIAGNGNMKTFHDTALAQYTAGVLGNDAELLALARQTATDWYRWQTGGLDLVLAGVVPWTPAGLDDSIEWTYRQGEISTRIQRSAWNDLTEELLHASSVGSYPSEPPGTPTPPSGSGTSIEVEYDDNTGTVVTEQERFPKASYTITSPGAHIALVSPIWGTAGEIQPVGSANAAGTSSHFARADHAHKATFPANVSANTTITVDPTFTLTLTGNALVFSLTTVEITTGTWTFDASSTLIVGGPLYVNGQMHWDYATVSLDGTDTVLNPAAHKPVYLLDASADTNLTGMAPAERGKTRLLINVSSTETVTLKNTGFLIPDNRSLKLKKYDSALLWCDGTDWYVVSFDTTFGPRTEANQHRGLVPKVTTAATDADVLCADATWKSIVGDGTGNVTMTVSVAGNQIKIKGNATLTGDGKLLVNAGDTIADYLGLKLVPGTNVTFDTITDGITGYVNLVVNAEDRYVLADGSDTSAGTLDDKIETGGILTKSVVTVLGQKKVLLGVNGGVSRSFNFTDPTDPNYFTGTLNFVDGRLDTTS